MKGKLTSITVEVESDETGKVISVHVIKSSQILELDSHVVSAYKNASFYPLKTRRLIFLRTKYSYYLPNKKMDML